MTFPGETSADGLLTGEPPAWKVQAVELTVFLLLILPSMVLSLGLVRQGGVSFPIAAVAITFRDLALLSLVLYFLWRNGEPFARIGWTSRRRPWREAALGVLLYVPFFFFVGVVEWGFRNLGLTSPSAPLPSFLDAKGQGQLLLALLLVIVVAVTEETVFRGYLLLRLRSVTGSTASAVVLSSFIFSLGHGYEGTAGLATVGVMGAIFCLVYLWRGSLVAPMTMHFLQDFLGIVLLPLLTK